MVRKSFIMLALLLVLALTLAACGQATTPAPAPAPEQPAVSEPAQVAGNTLATIKARGKLICGVNQAVPGFGFLQSDGSFAGFDIDFCKALSAAIFGDPNMVEYRPLTASERFTTLQAGEIDVLIRNTTWTLTRDTELGGNFVHTTFYDGQGIQVPVDSGINSITELGGTAICVQQGTTTELNLADQMAAVGVQYTPVVFETADETVNAYLEGRCDAWTTDMSGIVARQSIFPDPTAHKILPEVLSKEPLGPMVRHGDDQWFDIVQWTVFATFQAEEFGITSQNIDTFMSTENPNIRQMLGLEGEMGVKLGLSNDWAYNIVKLVGNYAEIFNRNLGPDTPLGLARGLNASWVDGGLLYAPPIR
ncbi:MAG: amino acid ABC transporter substrate-binding protein [Caldilineales bacterium]|nr:amino acid ABC transporter substrate-binding protein [Caldilineales bacterium]